MTRILSLDEIMEADDITEKPVEVTQWGGSVIVRSLSHRAMRDIKKQIAAQHSIESEDDIDEDELEKWIFIKGMVQPKVDEATYEQLLDKSTGAIQTILQGILGTSKTDEKAIKDAEKSVPAESVGVLPVQSGGDAGDDSSATADGESRSAVSL